MSLEAKRENFLDQLGYCKIPFVIYEEFSPGLPREFNLPDGLRGLRTGPVDGGTFRHPAMDWISGHPRGPHRTVELSTIFVYDPTKGEVKIQETNDILVYFRRRNEFLTEGWQLVPAGVYRIVGYRAFTIQ